MSNRLSGSLTGLRVLDLSANLAGPFATMILGDLGADVLKVERPGSGDDARAFGPFHNGISVPFLAMNRNKRSITLDLSTPPAIAQVLRLAAEADVFVESFRPGKCEALGLGYETLRSVNPRLVYASVSAFGDTGPGREWPGYDPIIQAFSGLMSMTGEADSGPVRVAASLTDLTTGMWLVIGIQSALAERARSGHGIRVSTSLIDSMLMLLNHQVMNYLLNGQVPQRLGSASPTNAPYEALLTSDGQIMVAVGNDRQFIVFANAIGLSDLATDERFRRTQQRVALRRELISQIQAVTVGRSTSHWVAVLRTAGIPCSPVNTLADALSDPVITERDVITTADGNPAVPSLPVVDLPLRADSAAFGPHRPPPTVGEHQTSRPEWLPLSVADPQDRSATRGLP